MKLQTNEAHFHSIAASVIYRYASKADVSSTKCIYIGNDTAGARIWTLFIFYSFLISLMTLAIPSRKNKFYDDQLNTNCIRCLTTLSDFTWGTTHARTHRTLETPVWPDQALNPYLLNLLFVCCKCCVCCQVVSATGWSLVQRSPTDCGVFLCVISEPQDWGGSNL